MNPAIKPISTTKALLLFGIPSILFLIICRVMIPVLHQTYGLHPALSWFIGGSLVFLPLFLSAFYLTRKDGFRTKAEIISRMRLRKMSARDWKFVLLSTLAVMMLTGAIMGISKIY